MMGGIGRWTALSGGPVRITSVRIAGERKVPRLRSAAPHFARDDKVEDDGVEDDVIEDGVEDDGVEDNGVETAARLLATGPIYQQGGCEIIGRGASWCGAGIA